MQSENFRRQKWLIVRKHMKETDDDDDDDDDDESDGKVLDKATN